MSWAVAGKLALADVRNWSKRHEVRVPITRALADAFEVLLKRITSGAPRCVPCRLGSSLYLSSPTAQVKPDLTLWVDS